MWEKYVGQNSRIYLPLQTIMGAPYDLTPLANFFLAFVAYFILLNTVVPISLYVTLVNAAFPWNGPLFDPLTFHSSSPKFFNAFFRASNFQNCFVSKRRRPHFIVIHIHIIYIATCCSPGWSPRANQCWTALFQRFYKFQRWSALFQNGLRKPALISAVSELFSAGFLWISAVQRWIKTNWETDENASCKFEKVLGSRKTCSFGVYQLWKNHSGEIPVKNSNLRTRLFLMLLGRTWPVE